MLNDSIYPTISEKRDILHYKNAARDQKTQNVQMTELVDAGCELIFVVPVDAGVEEGIKYAREIQRIWIAKIYQSCFMTNCI